MKSISLSEKLAGLRLMASRVGRVEEAELYLKRARLAAREERFDVARVFCEKAREADPANLAVLICLAQIHEAGFSDWGAAIELYQRVIARAGYDGNNPYCAAARAALSSLARSGNPQG
jgi:lipopolysaccharide biosynthesis regulator YciM